MLGHEPEISRRDVRYHGGGQDLIFPHHENEIAQSVCGHEGHPFVRYWMHNGYLMVEGEKMSKSLGNFYTVRDLVTEYPGEAIRLLLLKTHYRSPLDFTKDGIAEAKRELDRFYQALRQCRDADLQNEAVDENFMAALQDDLNTPLAISKLHELRDGLPNTKGELLASGNYSGFCSKTRKIGLNGRRRTPQILMKPLLKS
jgi:cysteinyl-tRNA synthetase